jgi:hypothetical protein
MPDRCKVGEHRFLLIRPGALRGYRGCNCEDCHDHRSCQCQLAVAWDLINLSTLSLLSTERAN